jgi:hypothetical protein
LKKNIVDIEVEISAKRKLVGALKLGIFETNKDGFENSNESSHFDVVCVFM